MKIDTNKEKINNILTRGVEDIFIKESIEKKLLSGKRLKVKLGFDPTGPKIHIGRAVILRKLREFQNLGHKVVFIVGDFTAQVGDPSDKLEKRPMLSKGEIRENLKNYKKQIGKIIDLRKAEFKFNSKWLKKLGFSEISKLAESFTVQQMLNRRNFKERYNNGQEISVREFMYPLMQGYDSVAVKADIELGGFDQLFNLKAGRTVQKYYNLPEQDVLTIQMLEGTDGRKMSTSWGNVINITDEPNEMFGKIMSLKDELIEKYLILCTDLSKDEIGEIVKIENPKDQKIKLAKEIIKMYHCEKEASKAEENFSKVFKEGIVTEDIKEIIVKENELLVNILLKENIIESKSEFSRLIKEGAVSDFESKEKIDNNNFSIKKDIVVKIGKRRFLRIKIS